MYKLFSAIFAQLGAASIARSEDACEALRLLATVDPLVEYRTEKDLSQGIRTLLVSVSNCYGTEDEYEQAMRAADVFFIKVSETPLYRATIQSRKALSDVPFHVTEKLSLMGGLHSLKASGPIILQACPEAQYDRFTDFELYGDITYDGLSFFYGLAAFHRHLAVSNCSGETEAAKVNSRVYAQSVIARTAASIFYLFFNENLLNSPAFGRANFFQVCHRPDIKLALLKLKEIFPLVTTEASKTALLKYAGALSFGFSSLEGTTGSLLGELSKILVKNDVEISRGFLAVVNRITSATAQFIKRKAPSPEADVTDLARFNVIITEADEEEEEAAAELAAGAVAEVEGVRGGVWLLRALNGEFEKRVTDESGVMGHLVSRLSRQITEVLVPEDLSSDEESLGSPKLGKTD